MVAYVVAKSGRTRLPGAARGRPRRRAASLRDAWAAWPATASATTSAGCSGARRRPTSAPTARTSTAPAARSSAGWLYAWVREPEGLLARHADAQPAAHREGGGRHHRLPDEPQERRVRGPAAARPRQGGPRRHHPRAVPGGAVPGGGGQARSSSAMDDQQRTLFLGEKTIGRYGCFGCHNIPGFEKTSPIGVELTEEGSKLVERLDFGFEHGKIPHTLPGLGAPEAHGAARLRRGQGEAAGRAAAHAEVPLRLRGGGRDRHRGHVPHQGAGAAGRPEAALARTTAYVEKGRRLVRDSATARAATRSARRAGPSARWWRTSSRAPGGDVLAGPGPLPADALQREVEDRRGRARAHRLAARLPRTTRPTRSGPGWSCACPPSSSREEELNAVTQYFAAQDKVPYPYEPKPAIEPGDGGGGPGPLRQVAVREVPRGGGQAPQPGPGQHGPRPRQRAASACARTGSRSGWPTPLRIQPGTRMPANFPADPAENAFPEILGGDQKKQIEAVRAYLLTLGKGGPAPRRARRAWIDPAAVTDRTPATSTRWSWARTPRTAPGSRAC